MRKQRLTLRISLALGLLFLFISLTARSQETANSAANDSLPKKLVVRNIYITGNKKTKEFVILREMHIRRGDSIALSKVDEELQKAKVHIYNSTLFTDVAVYPLIADSLYFDMIITVKEKWYILPIPHLELADRSFNEWVKTYNADLSRLSYGIGFSHSNFSGRRDELSVTLVNGFNRRLSFQYKNPYINKALTKGLKFGAGLSQTKEIPYKTSAENKLLYYEGGGREKREWNAFIGYTFRKGLKTKGTFTATFTHIEVSDSIIFRLNPAYFNSSSAQQNFIDLEYELQYENVDNVLYPLKGNTFTLSAKKRGLGFNRSIDYFSVSPEYQWFFAHRNQWYSSIRLSGEAKFPFDQPYFNTRALGYGQNYLRGYEYNVMDGVAFGLAKFDVKKKIAAFKIKSPIATRITEIIPFTIYAKTYADAGYVYNQLPSQLGNRFLFSGGIGFDIVTLFDMKLSLELSVNQLGQKGLFLHN